MKPFLLKNYRAIVAGGIVTLLLVIALRGVGLIIVNASAAPPAIHLLINTVCVAICWAFFSFMLYKYAWYRVLGVASLLLVAVLVEQFMGMFNPVTIPLLIFFWLGVAYLIVPEFFNKYSVGILTVYGAILSYFLIFRMLPNYVEDYHRNFLNFLLIPIPVLMILWGYEQWRWLSMLRADKAKAELSLLKDQINPHFLFNTLNNLYGLAVEKSEVAPAMILKLSDMMRYTIYEGKADYVPLQSEIDYLEDYIELHKIRYQRKVDISFRKDLSNNHNIAPMLLLLPLENAFKHGVEQQVANAFIELDIRTTSTEILFRISNNYEPDGTNFGGIGLDNLKQRLALIYPRRHKLQIVKDAKVYTLSLEINVDEVSNHRR